MEVAKGLIQLLLVSVIGVALSTMVFEYQRSRQLQDQVAERRRRFAEHRSDLIKDLLSRAIESYAGVKRERRLLRARGVAAIEDCPTLKPEPYDSCMEAVSDAQLRIEGVRRDIQTASALFGDAGSLVVDLQRMDEFLSSLIAEFERSSKLPRRADGSIVIKALPQISDFLQPFAASSFGREFAEPFRSVLAQLRTALLQDPPHLDQVS